MLDELFSRFDALAARHGLEKIKTIGDCYMAAAGFRTRILTTPQGRAARPRHARRGRIVDPARPIAPPTPDRNQLRTRRRRRDRTKRSSTTSRETR